MINLLRKKKYSNKTQNILILGATSSIARACAAEFAQSKTCLYLASRDTAELHRIATDLTLRYGIQTHYGKFEAGEFATHEAFWQQTLQTMKTIDGVLLAFGSLGDTQLKDHFEHDQQIITTNFTGAVSILNYCADYFTQQKQGFIIGLSSVAGDRGKKSNYIYGAAKAALNIYLQGLRGRLFPHGVKVLTIKLGFIDTAMTFGIPGLFWVAKPHKVAKKIVAALNNNSEVVYLPWFWRYLIWILKCIPEKIFKRLQL